MPPPQGTPNPIEGPGDYTFTTQVHNDTYPGIDPKTIDHSGHAVLVSGSSRGIGKGIAFSFAKAGVSFLAITGRKAPVSLVAELEAAATAAGRKPPRILPIAMEVTDENQVREAAALVEKDFGRLDVVVNNAGTIGGMAPIIDTSPDEWWQIMNVNVRGPYIIYKYFLPLLLKTKGLATVVNISSVGAMITTGGLSSYQTSKLALVRLAEHAAKEYAEQGLITYSVHPGNIATDLLDLEALDETFKKVFVETPELTGDTLAFLTSERREWLNGRYINCTWDVPEILAKKDAIVDGDMLKVKLVV